MNQSKFEQPKQHPNILNNIQTLGLRSDLKPVERNYLDQLVSQLNKVLAGRSVEELFAVKDLTGLEEYLRLITIIKALLKKQELPESDIEKELNLAEQYQEQIDFLLATEMIEPDGFTDITGVKRPILAYKEIKMLAEMKEYFLGKSAERGFTKMLIVPFGLRLIQIGECIEWQIRKLYQKMQPDADFEKVLSQQFLGVDAHYRQADVKGELKYIPAPSAHKALHHDEKGPAIRGLTKKEIIENEQAVFPGWRVIFVQDLKMIKDKKQMGTDPMSLLRRLEDFRGLRYTTPEEHLLFFLDKLYRDNEAIDNTSETNFTHCLNLGAFFDHPTGEGYFHNNNKSGVLSRYLFPWGSSNADLSYSLGTETMESKFEDQYVVRPVIELI